MRLLPFAEGTYEPGLHPYALRTRAGLVGAFVCFEAMYPELVRRIAIGGPTLLANLSNDAWFGAEAPARQHLDMARMRAIEERRWLLRATTTGISAIVDPTGRVVAASDFGAPAVLEGEVYPLADHHPLSALGGPRGVGCNRSGVRSSIWVQHPQAPKRRRIR